MSTARRVYRWLDRRLGITSNIRPIIEHPVPRSVNWWYVFGSATLVAFVVQVVTGVALAFSYVPSPLSAYDSLEFITNDATFGHIVRGIHYWGASAMVVLIAIHAARVFLMGSFKYPREMNWLTGVGLLLLTLGMAFTGQLLRWDQDAYWAVVVAAEQAGRVPYIGDILVRLVVAGRTVGGATLTRFYATHVFVIPALMFGLIGIHVYLVVRHGISEPPTPGESVDPDTYEEQYDAILKKDGIPFWPDAAWRDAIFALAVGAVVLALAIVVGPKELGPQADPTVVHAFPRPDWYFLWLFALLALSPPTFEDILIIGLPLVSIVVLVAIPFVAPDGERSPRRRPWATAMVGIGALAVALLIREGQLAPWSPDLSPSPLPASVTANMTSSQQDGAMVFQKHGCINCHTIAGIGGKRGPELTTIGDRLSRDQIIWRVLNGATNMPAYGTSLTPDQVTQLADFLAAMDGSRPTGSAPDLLGAR